MSKDLDPNYETSQTNSHEEDDEELDDDDDEDRGAPGLKPSNIGALICSFK